VRLQNDFGWDDKKVAELYKKGVAFVKKTKAYLDLPEKARVQMHAGNLSRAAANALLDLPSEKQDEILNKTSDKVEIMAEAAEALRTQGNKKGRKLVVYRNFKEIKRFLMEAAAGKNKVVSEAASIILDVVRGVVSEEEAHTRLEYLSSK
jgi:hypothetical protein